MLLTEPIFIINNFAIEQSKVQKSTSQDEETLSSEEIKPIALSIVEYAWLKASVSHFVENSVI